jgi:hypothetical protein
MRVAGETSHGRRDSLQRANVAGPVLRRAQARWRPHNVGGMPPKTVDAALQAGVAASTTVAMGSMNKPSPDDVRQAPPVMEAPPSPVAEVGAVRPVKVSQIWR